MLKSQDCVLLIKLLSNLEKNFSQRELAKLLFISQSEINQSLKRLLNAGLVRRDIENNSLRPVIKAAEEFIIHGIKYCFPVKPKAITPGIPTGIAAPVFKGKIVTGKEPLPVWPYAEGSTVGVALDPLYLSIPKAIHEYPDQNFYDLLALVDVLRYGRARERNIAIHLIQKRLSHEK